MSASQHTPHLLSDKTSEVIGDTQAERVPKIRINPRTGFPQIVGWFGEGKVANRARRRAAEPIEEVVEQDEPSQDEHSEEPDMPRRQATGRPKDETAEDKKARKQAVKLEKQAKREEKRALKDTYTQEKRRQTKMASGRVANGGAADVRHANAGFTVLKL